MLKSLRKKIIGDLRINRGQFLAVWFVVMLGTAFYGAMYPAGINMLASFYKTYDEANFFNFEIKLDPTDAAAAEIARDIAGVETVEGRVVLDAGVQLHEDNRYLITLRMISIPDDREPTVNLSEIVEGGVIQADDELLLLKSFADHHGYQVGDTIMVWIGGDMHPLKIAGLVFNAEYLVAGRSIARAFPTPSTFGVAWLSYSQLVSYTDLLDDGQINEVVVHLEGDSADENIELENQVLQALTAAYADYSGVVISTRTQTPSGSVTQALVNGNFPIMIFFSGVFLSGSVVMTSVLLGRVVQGERRNIGTMRAMGITRRELIEHYLSFGLLIGITGGFVGTIVGYLNSFWVVSLFIRYIAGGTLPGFTNVPQIDFLALGFLITVVGSVLAGIYPAWVESATPPGIALRPATPNNPGRLGQIAAAFLPLSLRQALRNMLRTPGRALSTALGVALGAMMVFSTFAMWDSFNTSIDDYFRANAFDLRLDMQTLVPADQLEAQVAAIDGVIEAQAALIGPITVVVGDNSFDSFAIAIDEANPFIKPLLLAGDPAFSHAEGVWIGHNLARMMSLEVGDTMDVSALGQTFNFEVSGIVSQVVGAPVFISRTQMETLFGGLFFASSVLTRVEDGQVDAVRNAMVDITGMQAVEVMDEFTGDINRYLEFFRIGTLIFGGFGYVLTLAVLFNTVDSSMRERQNEISVLRALGNSMGEIAFVIIIELMLMSVIGILVGVPVGREVGFYLQNSYNSEVYSSLTLMRPLSYILGIVSLLIIVVLSVVPGLRAAQGVDLGQVSKSQSL